MHCRPNRLRNASELVELVAVQAPCHCVRRLCYAHAAASADWCFPYTTITGMHQLERAGVRALMDVAVCTTERADALSSWRL